MADGALQLCQASLSQCHDQLMLATSASLHKDEDLSPEQTVAFVIVSVLLVVFSGAMAGLTLGLLSLDR